MQDLWVVCNLWVVLRYISANVSVTDTNAFLISACRFRDCRECVAFSLYVLVYTL